MAYILISLVDVCLKLKYYLAFLKTAYTIVLRKPRKSAYKVLNTWRPIVLLKTISKVVEKLLTKRIRSIVEEHRLLHLSQIGARAKQGTGTALKLLISIV